MREPSSDSIPGQRFFVLSLAREISTTAKSSDSEFINIFHTQIGRRRSNRESEIEDARHSFGGGFLLTFEWRRKFPFAWAPREGVEMLVSFPTRNKHRRRASRQSEPRPLIQPFLAASRPSAEHSKNVIKQTDISPSRSRGDRG